MAVDYQQFIDKDVYEMAKERIRHVIMTFDSILVAFSGGKDSLCVLNLVQEVYNEMGIRRKLKVFFRDEELIPDNVIDFVQSIHDSGKYDFRYYAIPLKSTKFILGNSYDYVQFDPDREWLRQPPPYAITLPKGDRRIFSQYEADDFICKDEKGKVAIINGIRADESLIRFRACINKKNENYINATDNRRIKLVKPIYDWTQKDVFLYFFKNNIRYCPIYDLESVNGEQFRVSTPLHAESAKRFNLIKTRDPKFYEGLVRLFPEMLVQERYWNEIDRKGNFDAYEHTYDGLLKYIDDTVTDPHQNELARKRCRESWGTRRRYMAQGRTYNFGGYPLLYLFKTVFTGGYKRALQPMGKKISYEYFKFEGFSEQQYKEITRNVDRC